MIYKRRPLIAFLIQLNTEGILIIYLLFHLLLFVIIKTVIIEVIKWREVAGLLTVSDTDSSSERFFFIVFRDGSLIPLKDYVRSACVLNLIYFRSDTLFDHNVLDNLEDMIFLL